MSYPASLRTCGRYEFLFWISSWIPIRACIWRCKFWSVTKSPYFTKRNKIDILRQIPHLRKISISPWANIDIAAEAVSGDYVIAAKASPSKLAVTNLDESSIRDELRHIINACRHNNCNFDIALKDITTVCGRPQNLFRWEQIASEVVREFDWM
mgnify:CR=1 FL=1